ncbi:MAG TPA: hypothetical protein VJ249_12090 [Candidatus Bathyarchaeia archaeon]|nr:hypothetical protein [Candidatus Bathyarchaeia archaeon]
MLSFEFSVFDLVLSLGVIVLIVLFATTLWKLNPSGENKQPQDEEAYNDEQEFPRLPHEQNPANPQQNAPPSRVDSWQSGGKPISYKTQEPPRLVVGATTEGTSQTSMEQPTRSNEYVGSTRSTKATTSPKPVPKNSNGKDCFHFFGYLGGLPKNTPIPGECFGCEKIVDCLITKKKQ